MGLVVVSAATPAEEGVTLELLLLLLPPSLCFPGLLLGNSRGPLGTLPALSRNVLLLLWLRLGLCSSAPLAVAGAARVAEAGREGLRKMGSASVVAVRWNFRRLRRLDSAVVWS